MDASWPWWMHAHLYSGFGLLDLFWVGFMDLLWNFADLLLTAGIMLIFWFA